MASALDRLLKKYTLEDSGSGDAGLLKKPATVAPAPTPAPVAPAAPSLLPAGWLLAGSPEARAYYNSLPDPNEIDPISDRPYGIDSGRWRPDIYNALAPTSERRKPRQDSYISGENEVVNYLPTWSDPGPDLWEQGGAVNYAYNPQTHDIVGVDANGNLIPGVGYNAAPNDQAFWNAGLLASALVGGAVADWAAAGNGMGNTAASTSGTGATSSTGSLPTSATDASLSQVPADYLGQSSITGTMPTADPSWFNPELLKMAAPTVAEKVTESKPDYTANPYSDPSRSLDTLPPSLNDTDPSWLDSLQGYGKDVVDWAKKNPGIAKLLFGATGAVLGGTGGSSGGGYSYSGPMPTISRQGWSPTAQQQTMLGGPSMGMLDVKPGEAMSGLWRYGLLGGGGK